MSFRVIHHEGTKELLFEKIKSHADQLKNDEYKDNFDEGDWEDAVDSIIENDIFEAKIKPFVLYVAINSLFPPVSDDYNIAAYEDLASKTSGKLADTLQMFVDGRDFFTDDFGNPDEVTCGYLTPDEVREFLELIKTYAAENEDENIDEDEMDFVHELIDVFSTLVEKKSGNLFIMS